MAKDKTKRLEVARFQMKMSKFGMPSFWVLATLQRVLSSPNS